MNLIELYNLYESCIEVYDTDEPTGKETWNQVFKDLWCPLIPFHIVSSLNHVLKNVEEERGYNVLFKYIVAYNIEHEGQTKQEQAICLFGDKDIEMADIVFNVLSNHMRARKVVGSWEIVEREAWMKKSYYNELPQLDFYKKEKVLKK